MIDAKTDPHTPPATATTRPDDPAAPKPEPEPVVWVRNQHAQAQASAEQLSDQISKVDLEKAGLLADLKDLEAQHAQKRARYEQLVTTSDELIGRYEQIRGNRDWLALFVATADQQLKATRPSQQADETGSTPTA